MSLCKPLVSDFPLPTAMLSRLQPHEKYLSRVVRATPQITDHSDSKQP